MQEYLIINITGTQTESTDVVIPCGFTKAITASMRASSLSFLVLIFDYLVSMSGVSLRIKLHTKINIPIKL